MAKITAPLFGLGARGQLGKVLVYFPWKGIDCAREYVIPTNPKTALQTAQRNKLTAAVDEFHAASYNSLDIGAWTRYASTLAAVMTGFNAMCRTHIKEAILGNAWERIANCRVDYIMADTFRVLIDKTYPGNVPTLHYGTSKTYQGSTMAFVYEGGDVWTATPVGLTKSTDYWFWVDCGASGTDYGRLGLYKVRTAAA